MSIKLPIPDNNLNHHPTSTDTSSSQQQPNFDFLWSEYAAQLAAHQEYNAAGFDIFPQPGFVLKCFTETTTEKQKNKRKVFVNICQDENISAPVTESAPANNNNQEEINPTQLRIPISIGPIIEFTDIDKSGLPYTAISIDIVLNPSTISQCNSDKGFRVFVCEFALEKISEKYSLKFLDELKFPKLRYKGKLPPPAQHIKKQQKKVIEEIQQQLDHNSNNGKSEPKANTEKAHTMESKPKKLVEEIPSQSEVPENNKNIGPNSENRQSVDSNSNSSASVPVPVITIPANATIPSYTLSYLDAANVKYSIPDWKFSSLPLSIQYSIEFLLLNTVTELDVEISSYDIIVKSTEQAITAQKHNYFLHLDLPFVIDDQSALAKFVKKTHTLNITLPVTKLKTNTTSKTTQSNSSVGSENNKSNNIATASVSLDMKKQNTESTPTKQSNNNTISSIAEKSTQPKRNWKSELNLTNSLIYKLNL